MQNSWLRLVHTVEGTLNAVVEQQTLGPDAPGLLLS